SARERRGGRASSGHQRSVTNRAGHWLGPWSVGGRVSDPALLVAMRRRTNIPFVSERNFVLATRDHGDRTLAAALAELIDNALQADSTSIQVVVAEESNGHPGVSLAVLDDGSGMDPGVLRHALRFGGSTRFNDRSGPGRYGMGLPNSSVSHARR